MSSLKKALLIYLDDPRTLLRYISAGGLAALVELTVFCSLFEWAGWPLFAANSFAFSIAVVVAFILHKHWTFKSAGSTRKQLLLYLLMQGCSGLLNNLLMFVLVIKLSVYAPLSKILQIFIVFFWNFTVCRFVIFLRRVPRH